VLHAGTDFTLLSGATYYDFKRNVLRAIPEPAFYVNEVVLHADRCFLSPCASKVWRSPNAEGNSLVSETISLEILHRLLNVERVSTEMEVTYKYSNWKIVDFIVKTAEKNVGVSVTRAMTFPDPDAFDADRASALLTKKIFGLVLARRSACEKDAFNSCILHVISNARKMSTFCIARTTSCPFV